MAPKVRALVDPLARRVEARLVGRCRVPEGARILVGVSGGADSVALLSLLVDVAPRRALGLEVAHFDHMLRAESGVDAEFVSGFAERFALPYHLGRWNSPRSGEVAARAARHAFLAETARARGCEVVALGHHLEDQIETFLLRLGRGAGVRGWTGMRWRRQGEVVIVRPLLDTRREELRRWLVQRSLEWREDATNAATMAARNRIRHEALPALDAALPPGWMRRIAAGLDDWRQIADELDADADRLLREATEGERALALAPLRAARPVVLRSALRRWLDAESTAGPSAERPTLGRRHLDAVARIVQTGQSGRRTLLPGGLAVVVEQGRIVLAAGEVAGRERCRYTVEVREVAVEEARRVFAARSLSGEASPPTAPGAGAKALLSAAGLRLPLRARWAAPGDRVRLLGAPGTKSLARVFQDRQVPRRLRGSWPLVEDATGIVWVPGIGVAERARITGETGSAVEAVLVSQDAGSAAAPSGAGAGHDAAEP
jgi:tRNA(Ile)-lysidine synthase